jgi:ribosomal protein L5
MSNHYHHHDSVSKFHFQHGLDKCKFEHGLFDTSLNDLIVNSKLLTPLYYTHLSLIGQKPCSKKSKKSIANFKLRPNMTIGTLTTLHPGSRAFESYLKHLRLCFLPSIKRQREELDLKIGVLGSGPEVCND